MTAKSSINLLFLYEARSAIPPEVNLSECSVEFFGEKRTPDLVTGVFGTKSKQVVLESLAKWNVEHQATSEQRSQGAKPAKLLMIDAQFVVDSLEAQRQRVTAESVAASGWLNMDRLTPGMRDELKPQWLSWIARSQGAARAKALEDENVLHLAAEYPQFVPNLFKSYDKLLGVLHPVRPKVDPHVTLWVATVRLLPKRFQEVKARHFDLEIRLR
jgi:hypothetical protein